MLNGNTVLAVIPARKGSKGITDKNISEINGTPLIGLVGECIKDFDWIDYKIVTSNSDDYLNVGTSYGLLPLHRPDYLALGEKGSVYRTMLDALIQCENEFETVFDIILLLEPTSPCRKPDDIEECVSILIDNDYDSVVTVSEVDEKYHNYRIIYQTGDDYEFGKAVESDMAYYRNGICYAFRRYCVMGRNYYPQNKTYFLLIDRPIVNIDTPQELELARVLLK